MWDDLFGIEREGCRAKRPPIRGRGRNAPPRPAEIDQGHTPSGHRLSRLATERQGMARPSQLTDGQLKSGLACHAVRTAEKCALSLPSKMHWERVRHQEVHFAVVESTYVHNYIQGDPKNCHDFIHVPFP